MLFSLIVGIILGAIMVVFALQNVAMVTLTFFAWQATAPLSVLILGTLLSGIALALLVLIPSVIRDEMYISAIKKQKRETEEQLARVRTTQVAPASSTTVQTTTTTA